MVLDMQTEKAAFEQRKLLDRIIKTDVKAFKSELKKAIGSGFDINREIYMTGEQSKRVRVFNLLYLALTTKEALNSGVVECLLDYGANPNANKNGYTPLFICAYRGIPTHITQRLIEAGAEVNAFSEPCKATPFSITCEQYIERYQYYFNMWNFEKARETDYENLKLLLEHDADPYLCDTWLRKRYFSKRESEKAERQKFLKQFIHHWMALQTESKVNLSNFEYEL